MGKVIFGASTMRDWLEKNIRGSLDAVRTIQRDARKGDVYASEGETDGPASGSVLHSYNEEGDRLYSVEVLKFSNSLMDCNDMASLRSSLTQDLSRIIDYDIGFLCWRPLCVNHDDSSHEFQEDDMPESMEFSTGRNILPGDSPVCSSEEMESLDSVRYKDSSSRNYRARTASGDPVLISLRSAIFVPLFKDDQKVASLALFSTRPRGSSDDIKKMLSPIWSMIGKTTGRILETESLISERDRTRSLLDGTDDIIVLWKNRGSMWEIDCNERAEEMIELDFISPDMMEGPFFVPPGKEFERALVAWRSAYRSGEDNQIDLELLDRSGNSRSFMCRFSPYIHNGDICGVRMTGVETDMLDFGIRQMGSSNRTYRLLLSVLSHDLKNPLSAVKGYNDLMEYASDQDRLRYTRKISDMVRRMNDTINMARTFSLIQEGKFDATFETIDVKEMVQNCIEMLYPATKDYDVVFSPERSDFEISGHRFLEQVFLNLIENAMKYSNKGSRIVVGLKADLTGVTMMVADRGSGVPDRYKEVVFTRFSRGKDTSGILGVGLGLAISREIVQMHQGRIWVEDNPGGGSVFKVFLPWK